MGNGGVRAEDSGRWLLRRRPAKASEPNVHQAVQDYLVLRRSLGFKLRCTGALLLKFAAFAESRGAEYVTTSLAQVRRGSVESGKF